MSTPPPVDTSRPRCLLHICCGPCATYPFSILAEEYEVTAYFYDPNIHPENEYRARLEESKKYFADKCAVIEGPYDATRWFALTKGLENEPEKGSRCTVCYDMRLDGAGEYAAQHGFECFTSVLSVSPHKDAIRINRAGELASAKYGVPYLPSDWKKKGGFTLGVQLADAAGLVRQDYCGCIYSRRDRDVRLAERAARETGSAVQTDEPGV